MEPHQVHERRVLRLGGEEIQPLKRVRISEVQVGDGGRKVWIYSPGISAAGTCKMMVKPKGITFSRDYLFRFHVKFQGSKKALLMVRFLVAVFVFFFVCRFLLLVIVP